MKCVVSFGIAVMALSLLAGQTFADDLFVYPAKGQSQEQTEKDKAECYQWAKSQTGFDPMAPPAATSPPPQSGAPEGGAVRGAARGALVGVAVGAIAGDAGKGAAIGAASGGLLGGMKRRDQVARETHAQEQWAQQQAAQYQQKRDTYNRAYKACLEGRNYTVK
jgi:hypothetical protein